MGRVATIGVENQYNVSQASLRSDYIMRQLTAMFNISHRSSLDSIE